MAKPIQEIRRLPLSDAERRERDLEDILQALTDHQSAVLETVELLQGLHERGILSFLNSLLANGDHVLAIMVKELNKPQNTRLLQNLAQLVVMMGSIELDKLNRIVDGAQSGLKEAAAQSDDDLSLLGLWRAMRDPEVQRALSILLGALKGIGREEGRRGEPS